MTSQLRKVIRPRGNGGRFVSTLNSSRSAESRENQRLRQKAYIARRTRVQKRVIVSFARAFIIKGQGKEHWLPATVDNVILFGLMSKLIKGTYLEPPKARLLALKSIYVDGDPQKMKKRLPRISIYDAQRMDDKAERQTAFVGWRFPFTGDPLEMKLVYKWLKDNAHILKVGIEEAKQICFNTFRRYVQRSNKHFYIGYPAKTSAEESGNSHTNPQETCTLLQAGVNNNSHAVVSQAAEADVAQTPKEEMLKYATDIMEVAKKPEYYRSLQLALTPSCDVHFDVLCTVWTSTFRDGKPPENWSQLKKDILQYCVLTTRGETQGLRYKELKQALSDVFQVLRMIRASDNLRYMTNRVCPLHVSTETER